MSDFKPILFSTEMVQAILDGRKTQTRRIIDDPNINKPDWYIDDQCSYADKNNGQNYTLILKKRGYENTFAGIKSPINLNDILWVRETYCECKTPDVPHDRSWHFCYRADGNFGSGIEWKPSLFLPKKAARIFLKVTSVRAERLQDISEEDAIAEGIEMLNNGHYKVYTVKNGSTNNPIGSFSTLWEKTYGFKNMKSNPWVWVYTFERIEKPENFI